MNPRRLAAIGAAALWLGGGLLLVPVVKAADAPTAASSGKRPKICLVLSGGGARGAAHVGVLKVLEEYRVPIDCIAGTSMGALVGAAYATGASVEELEEIAGQLSTRALIEEKPPREERNIRRKQEDYLDFVGPEFGVSKEGLKLPKGVVTGVQLETVLRKLSRVPGYHNFDKLPIPYRAVATDLVTGKAVVFSEGDLPSVMRASMAVPGAVAPAEFGGMILVDGMLTSNLPVQTAQAMGADIVIAVNVGTPLLKREQLTSILGVTGQMLSILTEQNVNASLAAMKPGDILISPELEGFSTGDFDRLAEIVPRGEVAARQVAEQLKRLSLPPEAYAALRQKQMVHVEPDVRPVDEVRLVGLKRVNPETLKAVIDTKPGEPLEQAKIDADLRRIYGTGDFEHVNYSILEDPSTRVMAIEAVEKTWGPDYLRFGLGLSSDFQGDAFFNLLAMYRRTWLNSLGAEWRTIAQIGHVTSITTEFYQPLEAQGDYFIAPYAAYSRGTADVYQGDDRIATYRAGIGRLGFDVGSAFRRYGELRLGVLAGTVRPALDTGPQSLAPQRTNVAQGAFSARMVLDRLDSVVFPRSGWGMRANIFDSNSMLGADDTYTRWNAEGSVVYSIGNHTLNFNLTAGGRIGNDPLPTYDLFAWGGFLRQSGYATGQLLGQNLTFGRLMYYHRILEGTLFEGAYGGISLELGKVGDPLVAGNPDGWLRSGSLFVGMDSPIGPAYLAYGRARDGNDAVYFFLGRPY